MVLLFFFFDDKVEEELNMEIQLSELPSPQLMYH